MNRLKFKFLGEFKGEFKGVNKSKATDYFLIYIYAKYSH